jgi:iron complex outermembrane receptor protein
MSKRTKLSTAIATAMLANAMVAPVATAEIEEIVVTATKRAASMQDISIAVQALDERKLDQRGVTNFEDYLLQLPGVTAGGNGPGNRTVYIRGVASTTPTLTVAGVAGLSPNVAFYLDEQPLSQPGRNLDVYAADVNRLEVLAGPQGTLYGASSQAGTVRIITNKPDPSDTYGSVKVEGSFTKEGDPSHKIEAMMNLPVSDRVTLRGVAFVDDKGGYIDNIAGQVDMSQAGFFRSEGTVRANGVPVSQFRAGNAAGKDLSLVDFKVADNADLVEDDYNDAVYKGIRVSGLWDINDDWSLLVSHMHQELETDGAFFADPNLGDYEAQRFTDESNEDTFDNTAWTLTGRIANLEVVYTGAFTERDFDQVVDYTSYMFVGAYLPYYKCDYVVYSGFYDGAALAGSTCYEPTSNVAATGELTVQTHEIRFSTDETNRWRATFGAFYSDLDLEERGDFNYLNQDVLFAGVAGFADNFPQPTAWQSDPGPFAPDTAFRNDIHRTDENWGIFGEVTIDLNEQFALTLGARYYDYEVDMEGSANSAFCNSKGFFGNNDANAFGTNISDLYDGDGSFTNIFGCATPQQTFTEADITPTTDSRVVGGVRAPDVAEDDGIIGKINLSWTPDNNQLYYATFSEGYRTGLLNRPGGTPNPQGTFSVPYDLTSDELTNLEFGWKVDLLDGQLRLNGSAYFMKIKDMQTTIFDTSIVNLFFSDNAADAEVKGIEGDFIWMPNSTPGLAVTGGYSFLDSEITKKITPTNDIVEGDELAYAPGFQGNLAIRYEWELTSGMTAHVMPHMTFSDDSWSDVIQINRIKLDSWTMVGFTAGVETDKWSATLYVDNLTDEKAVMSSWFGADVERVVYARPLTGGIRATFHF